MSFARAVASSVLAIVAMSVHDATMHAQGFTETVCDAGRGGISLSIESPFILLKGSICPGDEDKFRKLLKTIDPGVHTVKLVSGGGNGGAAEAIGKLLRSHKFNTYVDGAVDRCASACTNIFAAGVQRFYSGAQDIATGKEARRGLGYHYLDARHVDESDAQKDRKFNATAVPYLRQMLPASAADAAIALMRGNRTTQMIWLNGEEALRSGIATSLDVPR